MLNNKADAVEKYILKMLSENEGGQVELKRTDLADEISCAPSQVSYVLSTRFTNSRGFKVESQRGLGGYIRITIIENKENDKQRFYHDLINLLQSDENVTFDDIKKFLTHMMNEEIITIREAKLVAQVVRNFYELEQLEIMDSQIRQLLVKDLFETLSKIT